MSQPCRSISTAAVTGGERKGAMTKLEQSLGAREPLVRKARRLSVPVVTILLLAGACGQPQTAPTTEYNHSSDRSGSHQHRLTAGHSSVRLRVGTDQQYPAINHCPGGSPGVRRWFVDASWEPGRGSRTTQRL